MCRVSKKSIYLALLSASQGSVIENAQISEIPGVCSSLMIVRMIGSSEINKMVDKEPSAQIIFES